MPLIGNRAIIEETPLYFLFYPDSRMTPGFAEVVPKVKGNKRAWAVKIERHLRNFSDPFNVTGLPKEVEEQIGYQQTHRFSYSYKGGFVEVYPNEGRVGIEMSHPDRQNVVLGLMRLFWLTRRRTPASGLPNVQVVVNN